MAGPPTRALALTPSARLGFMLVEVVGGYVSGSLALLADAGHMLADAGALARADRAALGAPTPNRTLGLRLSARRVLAAFVNGIALAITAVFVVKEAVERFFPTDIEPASCWSSPAVACW
ncbi:MAG: cation transporter [Polyangiaceae bacterium]